MQRYCLTVSELLSNFVRPALSRRYFDGTELDEGDLREGLAKHAECCEDDEVDPSVIAPAMAKVAIMGNESTAEERVNDVRGDLEKFFERDSVPRAFRDSEGNYREGAAEVVTKALIAGYTGRSTRTEW